MNRIILFLFAIMNMTLMAAQSYTESYNTVSDGYSNRIEDIKVVRNINGGTVIIPEFDESCPEEMRAAFSYACKIVEEYLLPCLPLRVKVMVEPFPGRQTNEVSKLHSLLKAGTNGTPSSVFLMSRIKAVILAEIANNSNITFRPNIPDVAFLNDVYDIEITYNEQYIDNMSFSLDPSPENNYDFVSLAMRDLIKGMGLNSGFRYNPLTKGLDIPGRTMTYFEHQINGALGHFNSDVEKFKNATKGELKVPSGYKKFLRLYAPETWTNGISLNYFIPQEDSDVSNILSHNFYKNMVYRSLSDDYSEIVFKNLLGWFPDEPCGNEVPPYETQGSTSMLMPYLGSIDLSTYSSFNYMPYSESDNSSVMNETGGESAINLAPLSLADENPELTKYLYQFHPFPSDYVSGQTPEAILSVLKKDGTWDIVATRARNSGGRINMSDLTFHCEESEYARTIDGYLRGRISYQYRGTYGIYYNSTFFVIDYLPQKVTLKCKPFNKESGTSSNSLQAENLYENVRIYFSNTEGVEHIILERLKQGSRIPNKITINDVKKGYYDTTIDKTTTFTAVAYNKNGSSRGLPVTVVPSNIAKQASLITVNIKDRCIVLNSELADAVYHYEIRPVELSGNTHVIEGVTEDTIDISELSNGAYILSVIETNSNSSTTAKFKK